MSTNQLLYCIVGVTWTNWMLPVYGIKLLTWADGRWWDNEWEVCTVLISFLLSGCLAVFKTNGSCVKFTAACQSVLPIYLKNI